MPSPKNKLKKSKFSEAYDPCEIRKALDAIYEKYNRKEYLRPDPVQFLFDYAKIADREIVALIASSLAYGRVAQIIRSVEKVLEIIGNQPSVFLSESSEKEIFYALKTFKHRFTDGAQVAKLLMDAKFAIKEFSSLENSFAGFLAKEGGNYVLALDDFSLLLNGNAAKANHLLPRIASGSACKRLNLMIKWLVRKDEIDPGGWTKIHPSSLIIPLDTHMCQIASYLGFTKRKSANLDAAIEITDSFRKINPDDPCKYDFALTRLGIRNTKQMRKSISI